MTSEPAPLAFLGAGPQRGARWTLFGVPFDATTSFRPGARFGPSAIRAASAVLEDWSPTLHASLADRPFCDLGDLACPPADIDGVLDTVRTSILNIAADGARPLMLGGEHLITLPAVVALATFHPDLRVLQFDAHADLRADYLGRTASHATVMRRVAEVVGPGRCYQVGIRSATEAEWTYAHACTRCAAQTATLPAEWRAELSAGPVYVTVDIDFVDPAYAPGTGTPEPGGPSALELLRAVDGLAGLRLVGADVVEVAPAYDAAGITAVLAAKVIRQLLLLPLESRGEDE